MLSLKQKSNNLALSDLKEVYEYGDFEVGIIKEINPLNIGDAHYREIFKRDTAGRVRVWKAVFSVGTTS